MTAGGFPHSARPSASALTAFGMILEVREVHDRVAFDLPGGAGRRARRKCAARATCRAPAVLIEIAEGIDGRDREAGSGRRFGGSAGRDARDQDVASVIGSIPRRARAAAGEIT